MEGKENPPRLVSCSEHWNSIRRQRKGELVICLTEYFIFPNKIMLIVKSFRPIKEDAMHPNFNKIGFPGFSLKVIQILNITFLQVVSQGI